MYLRKIQEVPIDGALRDVTLDTETRTDRRSHVRAPVCVLLPALVPLHTMTLTSTDNSLSIFKDGKLKPGPYKIQNIFSETYLDFEVHSREICCRLGTDLGEGKGIVG